ncbi:MAG: PIN domain-containing protein [Planctomycetota bacterium]|nr:PIN domain-containing protein [Planctomycetota bacterium]
MRLYLDVSCLNRPFDDQRQTRVRLEAEAVILIFEQAERGRWTLVSSEMAVIEVDAIPDAVRQARVRLLLPESPHVRKLGEVTFRRAAELETLGFKPADAVHLAAAEELSVDVFLSCDDRLCRLAKRRRRQLRVEVANPLEWLKEIGDDADA